MGIGMGDEINVLSGGVETLQEMKNAILRLDELKIASQELKTAQEQRSKDIAAKQKAMEGEITSTISKRQAEVEKTFDDQITATRDSLKQVKAKRDKLKNTKVNERVGNETADLHEEIRSLKQDLKGIFTRQHISRMYNTDFFFTLFMPDGIGDFLLILLSVVIILAIPAAVYFMLPINLHKWWMMALLYIVVLGAVLGIFSLLFKKIRNQNLEALSEAKKIREKIAHTNKKIKKLTKSIRNDKDESNYGLEKFDDEMVELDSRIDEIIQSKKQALTAFESQTKKDITNEIKARLVPEIEQLQSANEQAYTEQRKAEEEMNSLSMDVSSRYGAYVGKENLSVPMIDGLIEIINSGDATNIADAIAHYKRLQTEAKKES